MNGSTHSSTDLPVRPIVVVGAGVFGLSTALELTNRGYQNVKVLDRHLPPVPDGSSVDISRVIRYDYADRVYNQMAREAYAKWKTEYAEHFAESGFVMLSGPSGNSYREKAQELNTAVGQTLEEFGDANEIRRIYPHVQARLHGLTAVHQPRGGWADAAGAIQQLSSQCSKAGVSFITGRAGTVASLKLEGNTVVGVNVAEGPAIPAAEVILATGAWSNRLLGLEHATIASGQPVGFIQLTPQESAAMSKTPVMINFETGVFIFPPHPKTNLLKLARHGYGFSTDMEVNDSRGSISSPKLSELNSESGYLPPEADAALREGLRLYAPQVADREWQNRRLCWYSDTPEGDFIIDHHSGLEGLFFATGGAGHAFKMLPILGRYVVDCFEDKAPPDLRRKWRLRSPENVGEMGGDGSRAGPPLQRLTHEEQSKL